MVLSMTEETRGTRRDRVNPTLLAGRRAVSRWTIAHLVLGGWYGLLPSNHRNSAASVSCRTCVTFDSRVLWLRKDLRRGNLHFLVI